MQLRNEKISTFQLIKELINESLQHHNILYASTQPNMPTWEQYSSVNLYDQEQESFFPLFFPEMWVGVEGGKQQTKNLSSQHLSSRVLFSTTTPSNWWLHELQSYHSYRFKSKLNTEKLNVKDKCFQQSVTSFFSSI